MSKHYVPTSAEVKELRARTNAGMNECKRALKMRFGMMDYAVEYIQRSGLAAVMSDEARYPKWTRYLLASEEDVDY